MSKMLDKVSKILNQAENASTPEEAATFMAKAQELASINAIDLAVARMHQAKKERITVPEERRVQVNTRTRRHNKKHFIELAMAIADANDVKYLVNDYYLFAIGFPSDIDMVEALLTHLSVQMVTECDEALARGDHKQVQRLKKTERVEIPWDKRAWGQWNGKTYYDDNPDDHLYYGADDPKRVQENRDEYLKDVKEGNEVESYETGKWRKPVPPPFFEDVPVRDSDGNYILEDKFVSAVDGRVFRSNFYEAFVSRMRGRLWEIRRAAERDAGVDVAKTSDVALALVDKKEQVDSAYENRIKVGHVGTWDSPTTTYDDTGIGRKAGTKAAETVPVGNTGRGVKG